MPRRVILSPHFDPNRSLGWLGLSWIEFFVRHGPGAVRGRPVHHGTEYSEFIVRTYGCGDDPTNNHLLHDSIFCSRPKGCDKSGLAARMVLFDCLGPSRWCGWAEGGEVYTDPYGYGFTYTYMPGEPMGREIESPFARIMATEEGQTGNTFRTIYYNLTDDNCPLSTWPGLDVGKYAVLLKGGGEIRTSTASASSKDGGLETTAVFDETHLYDTAELKEMKETVVRNLEKRKAIDGTYAFETTTMFEPGAESAAEETFIEAESVLEGRKKRGAVRIYYDHRWGVCDDLADEPALRAALRDAYGDAMAWMSEDAMVNKAYDSRTKPAAYRRYTLNAQTSTSDSWLDVHEWDACRRPDRRLKDGDLVVLGGDGSIRDDATAVVACRVSDGHIELLDCWEKPEGAAGEGWQVDREAVDACIARAMTRFDVAGFYFDPPHWADYLDRWHNEYAADMRVQATQRRPLEWWSNRPTQMVLALQRFHDALLEKRVSFTPAEDLGEGTREAQLAATLRRHALNARRNPTRAGLQIRKETPKSAKKIDAVMAAVIAWECRSDAVAAGVEDDFDPATFIVARRLR